MPDLVVVVPSRGRPEVARALALVFQQTCTAGTELVFAVDDDDPARASYETAGRETACRLAVQQTRTMVEALNRAAVAAARDTFAVGFMGDDHYPRTVGWDQSYVDALRDLGSGIVYGDDLLQGRRLPTQCAMTSDIVRALGYMAPPGLKHLFVDNFWLSLGTAAGCIRYLPDVVVEHRHPVAGVVPWDASYARVNNSDVYVHDQDAFEAYARSGFDADVAKVAALRAVRV